MTIISRLRRLTTWAMGLALMLGVGGCSFTTPQSSLDPKGPVAQVQLDLFYITVWVCLGIFIVVGGALVWVVWRFRERPGDDAKPMPSQGHGNPLIEIGLIGASIFLLVIIAIPTLRAIWFTHDLPEEQPYYAESKLGAYFEGPLSYEEKDNVLEINVTGWQWWFAFEYPQLGFSTANEFVIPKGKVVKFNLRGEDVIHSFWLPKLAGKVDLIPGRKNWMWLMAEEEGYYFGQCAEFCGDAHAYMLFRAEVVSDEAFNEWVADYRKGAAAPGGFQAEPTEETPNPTHQDDWMAWAKLNATDRDQLPDNNVTKGAQLFMGKGQCLVCHAIDGSPAQGASAPNLTKVAQRKSLAAGILNHYTDGGTDIDAVKQREHFYEWVAKSHEFKPGNLMYYRSDAGLMNLKSSGLTYADLVAINHPGEAPSIADIEDQLKLMHAPEKLEEEKKKIQPFVGAAMDNLADAIAATDKQLRGEGVSEQQLTELQANAGADLSAVIDSQYTLREIVEPIEEDPKKLEKLAEVSGWLTDEEFQQIADYLMTLK